MSSRSRTADTSKSPTFGSNQSPNVVQKYIAMFITLSRYRARFFDKEEETDTYVVRLGSWPASVGSESELRESVVEDPFFESGIRAFRRARARAHALVVRGTLVISTPLRALYLVTDTANAYVRPARPMRERRVDVGVAKLSATPGRKTVPSCRLRNTHRETARVSVARERW